MDAALLGFLEEDNASSFVPSVNQHSELEFLFSSPTTVINDESLRATLPPAPLPAPSAPLHPPSAPLPSQPPHHFHPRHDLPHIDPMLDDPSLRHTNSSINTTPFDTPLQPHPQTPSPLNPRPDSLTLPTTSSQSQAPSQTPFLLQAPYNFTPRPTSEHTISRVGKKRPLSVMKSLAKKNAPKASLTDDELLKIGAMSEPEHCLAESRELYEKLVDFKNCLGKYGYRMSALYVDSVPSTQSLDVDSSPFDFIINKDSDKPTTKTEPSTANAPTGDASVEVDVAMHPQSPATFSTSDTSLLRNDAISRTTRPRKRSRVFHKGESNSHGARRIKCAVCCKKMADTTNLVRHFRHTHQELKPFQCPKCGGHYSSEGTLWHHISNVHTDRPRTHKCEFCDASYDSCGAKTRHVHGTHHTNKPLYPCPFKGCKRTFVFPAHLEAHAQSEHNGFRPFQCRECSKAFSSANGLVRHCREVHRREKAYTCPLCQSGLTKRCHLKRHLLNVHHMDVAAVDEEMKKHPNPADIPSVVQPRFTI